MSVVSIYQRSGSQESLSTLWKARRQPLPEYIHIYLYIYVCVCMQSGKQCVLSVIITMALWSYHAPCFACWALFGALVEAMCNRISCAQVHELPQSYCGDNQVGTLFWWLHIYFILCLSCFREIWPLCVLWISYDRWNIYIKFLCLDIKMSINNFLKKTFFF